MAMERFFKVLVFYEVPLVGYGTSVLTARAVNRLMVSRGSATKPAAVASRADAESEEGSSDCKATAHRRAGFEIAFDGINCFDTVVMLKISGHVAAWPAASSGGDSAADPSQLRHAAPQLRCSVAPSNLRSTTPLHCSSVAVTTQPLAAPPPTESREDATPRALWEQPVSDKIDWLQHSSQHWRVPIPAMVEHRC
ncbi:hypothetical protein ZWY2020_057757 [Hordeum vulgare]|nr:hypothetical protein ZWY2020_057757 [Hordeum vulgare]